MMTTVEREEALNSLHETRAALLQTLEAFPKSQFGTAPGEGCWSAAQVMEHVVSVETNVLKRIQGALLQAVEPGKKSGMEGRDEEFVTSIRSREKRIKVPNMPDPAGSMSPEELLTAFEGARSATIQFASQCNDELRQHFAPHRALGELDCYQWLMLIPAHCERHRKQIEECRERVLGL